ncbi:MAG: dUTP diphosphatase [Myxococcales bacterium]|nr:dUTP diphosphatase [Myxococcales bacterium]
MNPPVQIRRLREDVVLPRYMSAAAAGADLAACLDGPLVLQPGDRRAVDTGLAMAIADGYEGQVRPRSGLAIKQGLTVVNAPGTIDSDYRGEVKVLLVNLGSKPVTIAPGQRIAQLVIAPVVQADFRCVDELSDTVRGDGGFGSTGRGGSENRGY